MSNLIDKAREFAITSHSGQFRRDGVTPYIEHPKSVANLLHQEGEEVIAVAWLHDVIEDCNVSKEDLVKAGFPSSVVGAVVCLTKSDNIPYEEYIKKISQNQIAKIVKIADIHSNLADSPTEKQRKKYKKALKILQDYAI